MKEVYKVYWLDENDDPLEGEELEYNYYTDNVDFDPYKTIYIKSKDLTPWADKYLSYVPMKYRHFVTVDFRSLERINPRYEIWVDCKVRSRKVVIERAVVS